MAGDIPYRRAIDGPDAEQGEGTTRPRTRSVTSRRAALKRSKKTNLVIEQQSSQNISLSYRLNLILLKPIQLEMSDRNPFPQNRSRAQSISFGSGSCAVNNQSLSSSLDLKLDREHTRLEPRKSLSLDAPLPRRFDKGTCKTDLSRYCTRRWCWLLKRIYYILDHLGIQTHKTGYTRSEILVSLALTLFAVCYCLLPH